MKEETEPYNRIVLVGNGFDLAVGMKSKFSDFILYLFKRLILKQDKRVRFGFHVVTKYQSSHTELNRQEMEHLDKLKSTADIISFLSEQNKSWTSKYELLNRIISDSLNNWVNIESLYFKLLNTQYDRYEKQQLSEVDLKQKISEYNETMTLIGTELAEYLKFEQNELNSLTNIEVMSGFIDLAFEPFIRRKDIEQKHVDPSWQKKRPKNAVFVNFNYTNILEKMLETRKGHRAFKHLYIHGSVNTPEQPIIFGYGDDTSEKYKRMEMLEEDVLLEKIKSFQYPRTENYHLLLNILDEAKFEVFIFGHSCGVTDKTLLNTIFEHKNCFGIKNFHHSGEPSDFKKRMAISRHFTDKKLMRERVFPFDESAKFPENSSHK